MIALVDYGAGNLASVRKGFDAAGAALFAPGSPADLGRARGIVVPGVGHFDATRSLAGGWFEEIANRVQAGVPIFGICLGMQWLFDGSDEAVDVRGLGALRGTVRRLDASSCKVPHVGWNTLEARDAAGILDGVEDASYVYFSHAFAAPVTDDCIAATTHGTTTFAAVAQREHVCGVQFHPEKSGPAGIRILRNFAALTER